MRNKKSKKQISKIKFKKVYGGWYRFNSLPNGLGFKRKKKRY